MVLFRMIPIAPEAWPRWHLHDSQAHTASQKSSTGTLARALNKFISTVDIGNGIEAFFFPGFSSSLYSQTQSQAGLVLNIPGALVLLFPCCVTL